MRLGRVERLGRHSEGVKVLAHEFLRQGVGPFFRTLVIASLLVIGDSAAAAITTYVGIDLNGNLDPKNTALVSLPNSNAAEANFLAQLSAHGTETFESFANPTFTSFGMTFGAYGTGILSSSTGDPNYSGRVREQAFGTTNTQGRYTISGSRYFETDPGAVGIPSPGAHGNTGDFIITFTSPVTAFGFYATDVGDFLGVLQVTFHLLGGGTHLESIGNSSTTSGVIYLGVTTDDLLHPFTSVTFHDTTPNQDFLGFDNLTAGTLGSPLVPEPGALAIWGIGTFAFGMMALRRKAWA